MESLTVLVGTLVVASSIWVGLDAYSLGARKGLTKGGLFDMGPVGWTVACLLFWILAFPLYLANRGGIKRAVAATSGAAASSGAAAASSGGPPPEKVYYPAFRHDEPSPRPVPSDRPAQYWVRLAGGEFGPFHLERLQEFVGTGQLKPDTLVRDADGVAFPAARVPGLRFPGLPQQVLHAPSGPPVASPSGPPVASPSGPPVASHSGPPVASPSVPFVASLSAPSVASHPESPARKGAAPLPSTSALPLSPVTAASAAASAPSALVREVDRFPPSPFQTGPSGASGSNAWVIGLLAVVAVIGLLNLVLRHTVPGPKEAWEYKVESAQDDRFEPEFTDLGGKGWEMVSCRRALVSASSGESKAEYRYECILKRRAGSVRND